MGFNVRSGYFMQSGNFVMGVCSVFRNMWK